jgi:hypothetical protein
MTKEMYIDTNTDMTLLLELFAKKILMHPWLKNATRNNYDMLKASEKIWILGKKQKM